MTFATPQPAAGMPPPHEDRTPPCDPAAEAAVLGSILIDPAVMPKVLEILGEDCEVFFKSQHTVIFETLLELYRADVPIGDGLIVTSTLADNGLLEEAGGISYMEELVNTVPSAAHAEHYARMVHGKWLLRRMISRCVQTIRQCYAATEDPQAITEDHTRSLLTFTGGIRGTGARPVGEVGEVDATRGMATGLRLFDLRTHGLKSSYVVIGARPSVGKTLLLHQILNQVCVSDRHAGLLFSLEMSAEEVKERFLHLRSGMSTFEAKNRKNTDMDLALYGQALSDLGEAPLLIDDTPSLSLVDLVSRTREAKRTHNIQIAGIDYLQLMSIAGEESRVEGLSKISRTIKMLSRELNIPIVALAQLNRVTAKEKRIPRLDDIRDCGSIEQDADIVVLIHRKAMTQESDSDDPLVAESQMMSEEGWLIMAKNRGGTRGISEVRFLSTSPQIVEIYH